MNKVIITTEELSSIKNLQQKYTEIALVLGKLEIQKIELSKMYENTKLQLAQLGENESNLIDTLNKKYGTGQLNVHTGEFILE